MRSVFRTGSRQLVCALLVCALLMCAGLAGVVLTNAHAQAQTPAAPETAIQFLSGHGPEDAVPWDFLCTAGTREPRAGRRSPVPSCWELQGFGTYNYGNEINDDATVGGTSRGSTDARSPCRPTGATSGPDRVRRRDDRHDGAG